MNAAITAGGRFAPLRLLGVALLAALIVPLLMTSFAPAAHADGEDERANYSLYQLASNASTYFGEKNSPDGGDGLHEDWNAITRSPATGGDMLGYADPDFSMGDVIGWLFAEATGSTQTITYDTLRTSSGEDGNAYAGMLDYAHFGAANADLGLDTMSSGIGGQIMSMIGGSVIWVLYLLALAVGTVFYVIIQLLKAINPFMWFYQAVAGVADASGSTDSAHQQELADGMTGDDAGGGALAGLQHWISSWYGLLQSIAWEALVPLFIGFLLIGLVLFKKMDRGSAIKKLIVRIVFIGVGLPLLGSMYTGVLDKFDDSLLGQHSGPTRVVLSTYVDFEAWMMNDRLSVPDQATISWEDGQAGSESLMSVRNSALAINAQANSDFGGISVGTKTSDAEAAWRAGTVDVGGSAGDDVEAVFSTFGILNKYISGQITSASDFESGIKSAITDLDVADGEKKEWFVDDRSYGDVKEFGEQDGPAPSEHPVLATAGTEGLASSNPGGSSTTFTTPGSKQDCGFSVMDADGNLASCNLSALSAYNYLNTGFGPDSLTMYSSNNVTSGLTREDHMAVSQVGTGPAKFMYWHNAVTVLGCIVLLGFWYAIGMLAGAVKRTFSLVAAIPFATLGALSAIAKVVVYSTALILEVIVTLFVYQFVSELLISIPDIIAGPVSSMVEPGGLFGSPVLGGIIVVLLTIVSSLLVMGVTFALLRVRKVVLQAMDEVFTKLADKFLETGTPSKADKAGSMPSPAQALGTGAGAAAGQKLASGIGGKVGGGSKGPKPTGQPTGKNQSTNAGGLNGQRGLPPAGQKLAIGPGGGDSSQAGEGPRGGDQGGRAIEGSGALALSAGAGSDGDKSGPLQLTSGKPGSSRSDKETAQSLSSRGGLSNLGYSTGDQQGPHGGRNRQSGQTQNQSSAEGGSRAGSSSRGGQTGFGSAQGGSEPNGAKQVGQGNGQSNGRHSTAAIGSESAHRTSGGRKAIAAQSFSTQFGTGQQGAQATGQDGRGQMGARFTAGTSGPAQLRPGRASNPASAGVPAASSSAPTSSTEASRAAKGQQPKGQAGVGQHPTQGAQVHGSGGAALPGTGQGPRSRVGTTGAAALSPGRAGTPATPGALSPSAATGSAPDPSARTSGSRAVRPTQGQPFHGREVPGLVTQRPTRAAGSSPASVHQGQSQGKAPSSAPPQSGRRSAHRPVQQPQAVQSAGQRPQQGQRRVQVDRSVASGSTRRPSTPQPMTGSTAPKQSAPTEGPQVLSTAPALVPGAPASAPKSSAQKTKASKPSIGSEQPRPQQQAPAKPRRAAERPVPPPKINHKREEKE
ncbi:hypothetical protein [Zhihengliuella sp.]|uniref:hypothetical protein n=1 Tax=Zhihengliuella sp. TaxID=1954483 RepID=UPI002811D5AB|nr:hypothetical protein [Zhihengliuella sp.]